MTVPDLAVFVIVHQRPGHPDPVAGTVSGFAGLAPLPQPIDGIRFRVRVSPMVWDTVIAIESQTETLRDRLCDLAWALRLAMARGPVDQVNLSFVVHVLGSSPVTLRSVLTAATTSGDDYDLLLRLVGE